MDNWLKIQEIFLAVADVPKAERRSALNLLCGSDHELLLEVESLLSADIDSASTIDFAIQSAASAILGAPFHEGEWIGPYRVLRELGHGGMGWVYLAVRDDNEYKKEVALKVVSRDMTTDSALLNFRAERQILANLDHPYIARLLDGGTTAAGIPFFVMEYVEGKPIHTFCSEQGLNLRERCELFLKVLDAVSYAHRNFIVHGDLKPANIFVKADGTPRLLDFGVAKFSGAEQDAAASRASAFTPGYASPEQAKDGITTVLTDIYSLGAVLFEILTGSRAHGKVDAVGEICAVTESDLRLVVKKALARSPTERYFSADALSADLKNFLTSRPVMARTSTLGYRTAKFLRRNWLSTASGLAVVLALVVGLALALQQARTSQHERMLAQQQRAAAEQSQKEALRQKALALQQAQLAESQRKIAEAERDAEEHQRSLADRRTADIILLAGETLFDEQAALASVPNSIPARRKIAQTTLRYLESLEKSAGDSEQMSNVIAEGYYKLALAQGDPRGPSLQDTASAEQSLLKAERVLLPSYRRHPESVELTLRMLEVKSLEAQLDAAAGKTNDAVRVYQNILPLAHHLRTLKDCDEDCDTQEPAIENFLAQVLMSTDAIRALAYAERGIAVSQAALLRHPDNVALQQGLGSLGATAAAANKKLGNLHAAAQGYETSIASREVLLHADPQNGALRRNLMIAYGNYAQLLDSEASPNLDQPEKAREYASKCVAMARQTFDADKANATARRDLGIAMGRLGIIEPSQDKVRDSLHVLREADEMLTPLLESNTAAYETSQQLADIVDFEGLYTEMLGEEPEAIKEYQRSIGLLAPFVAQPKIGITFTVLRAQGDLARAYARMGENSAALDLARKTLAEAEAYASAIPSSDVRSAMRFTVWSNLAFVEAAGGMKEQAKKDAEHARDGWRSIANDGLLSGFRRPIRQNTNLLNSLN